MRHPARLHLVLTAFLALLGTARATPPAPADADPDWDFLQETPAEKGLSTGDVVEMRFQVRSDRGLRVVLEQCAADTAGSASRLNDLDLEVEGPDGVLEGHAFPEEAPERSGPLQVEHVELTPEQVAEGIWTVRIVGEWVPAGPEGYRLQLAGDVQEIFEPGAVPPHAELAQNDPNPLRLATTIRFTLERRSDILLGVYDIAGRPVRTLASGSSAAGPHSVSWDARDAAGAPVVPGIYFYRLEGSGFDITRKLVVIR